MNRRIAYTLGAAALAMLLLQPITALADPPPHARNDKRSADFRHWDRHDDHWRHYAARRGYVVHHLPPRVRHVYHRGHRYYYGGGAWYRAHGPRFVVVAPPVGLTVPFLPAFQATVHVGGVPYYRADSVYYVWQPGARSYVVTERPYPTW